MFLVETVALIPDLYSINLALQDLCIPVEGVYARSSMHGYGPRINWMRLAAKSVDTDRGCTTKPRCDKNPSTSLNLGWHLTVLRTT